MNLLCLLKHKLHPVAPLYNECVRPGCGQGFYTDYLESRARGRVVRIPVSSTELARAKRSR